MNRTDKLIDTKKKKEKTQPPHHPPTVNCVCVPFFYYIFNDAPLRKRWLFTAAMVVGVIFIRFTLNLIHYVAWICVNTAIVAN